MIEAYSRFLGGATMKIVGCCLMAALLIGSSVAAPAEASPSVAGTYEIQICKSKCEAPNTSSVIAHGILIVSDRPLTADESAKVGKMDFAPPPEEQRACFSGSRPEQAKTYAFIVKRAAIGWSLENEVLKLELFRSIDAGYNAELRIDAGKLSGTGHSWGAGAAAPDFSSADALVGHRIGPPDISACFKDVT